MIAVSWGALRAFVLWPQAVPEPIRDVMRPHPIAATELPIAPHARGFDAGGSLFVVQPKTALPLVGRVGGSPAGLVLTRRRPDPDRIALAMVALMTTGQQRYLDAGTPQMTPPVPGARPASRTPDNRWSASAWVLLRDGSGSAPGLGGAQLGGGQAGLRIAYALGDARRVAVVGRVVSAVSVKGREAALGIEWRPTRLPLRLVVEQRFSLDGGKTGPTVGVIGGTGPAHVGAGFDLETYGQAGAIRRDRIEPFADGAARLTRNLGRFGKAKVELGLGAWGGAQRDAQRLDLGPTIGLRLAVGGKAIRVSADWRQRVAGAARPRSGPALTIGGDF